LGHLTVNIGKLCLSNFIAFPFLRNLGTTRVKVVMWVKVGNKKCEIATKFLFYFFYVATNLYGMFANIMHWGVGHVMP